MHYEAAVATDSKLLPHACQALGHVSRLSCLINVLHSSNNSECDGELSLCAQSKRGMFPVLGLFGCGLGLH